MSNNNNIENLDELFRNTLDKVEFDAPDGLWKSIESGLESQGLTAGQTGGSLAKGALIKAGSLLVAAGLALGAYFYFSDNKDTQTVSPGNGKTRQEVSTTDQGDNTPAGEKEHPSAAGETTGNSTTGQDANTTAPGYDPTTTGKGHTGHPGSQQQANTKEQPDKGQATGGVNPGYQGGGRDENKARGEENQAALWFGLSDTVVCADNLVLVTNRSAVTGDIRWIINGSSEHYNNPTFSYTFTRPGVNTITMQVGDRSVTRKVYVEQVEAAYTVTYLGKGRFRFTGNCKGASRLSWNFGDRTPAASGKTIEHTFVNPGEEGRYSVTLTAYGKGTCQDTFTMDIINTYTGKKLVPVVPNVFSPNGDNINDRLEVSWEGKGKCSIAIFDASGNRVFETVTAGQQWWDGTNQFTGKPCPEGWYIYMISYVDEDGNLRRDQGKVMLVP